MLALGRAMMAKPRVLLLDEPSLGLAPLLVREIFAFLAQMHESGTTIVVVEQNASPAWARRSTPTCSRPAVSSLAAKRPTCRRTNRCGGHYLGY